MSDFDAINARAEKLTRELEQATTVDLVEDLIAAAMADQPAQIDPGALRAEVVRAVGDVTRLETGKLRNTGQRYEMHRALDGCPVRCRFELTEDRSQLGPGTWGPWIDLIEYFRTANNPRLI